ncbi:Sensor histidine kinase YycG [Anaerohalosphaera lusitana]|uniref:histidine kinase n=2 Tax=Anaerohalosphaera lusitana TaxID=1936003 RepID=A0A1U9NNP4_9BACT|nr:Sensor histidine kinase YycG [Anaerohalosphaera lusitana]
MDSLDNSTNKSVPDQSSTAVGELIGQLEDFETSQLEMLQCLQDLPNCRQADQTLDQLLEKLDTTSAKLDSLRQRLDPKFNDPALSSNDTVETTIFDYVSDGVIILEAGKPTYVNKKAALILTDSEGIELAEITKIISELGLTEMLETEQTEQIELKRPSGKYLNIQHHTIDSSQKKSVFIIEDRTEKIAGKKAKSDFIAAISHELRTPVTCIRNAVSNILAGVTGKVNPKTRTYLEKVRSDCHRFSNLVSDLLDVSKLETGVMPLNREPVRLASLIRQTTERMRHLADEKNINLEFTTCPPCSSIYADPQRLPQSLSNILDNAIKFTPAEGRVTVEVSETTDNLTIAIKDTGIGIPKSLQPRIFEKFYQIGRQAGAGYKGAGLGLPLSKGIVEAHGGAISLESTEKQGSTFFLTMPRTDPAQLLKKRLSQLEEQVTHTGETATLMLVTAPDEANEQITERMIDLPGAVDAVLSEEDHILETSKGEVLILFCDKRSAARKKHDKIRKILHEQMNNSFGALPHMPMVGVGRYPGNATRIDKLEEAVRENLKE